MSKWMRTESNAKHTGVLSVALNLRC